jgi:hypothetical protein
MFKDPGSFNRANIHSRKPWKWSYKQQNEFDKMKNMAQETIMAYPNFKIPFKIHTDASAYQLGACISQNGKPIAFYSQKMTPAQPRYTTTEWKLPSILETLKDFQTILLGQNSLFTPIMKT